MPDNKLAPEIRLTDSYNDTLRAIESEDGSVLMQIESEDGERSSVALSKEQVEQFVTFLTS